VGELEDSSTHDFKADSAPNHPIEEPYNSVLYNGQILGPDGDAKGRQSPGVYGRGGSASDRVEINSVEGRPL